jgi:hypothetical protein
MQKEHHYRKMLTGAKITLWLSSPLKEALYKQALNNGRTLSSEIIYRIIASELVQEKISAEQILQVLDSLYLSNKKDCHDKFH